MARVPVCVMSEIATLEGTAPVFTTPSPIDAPLELAVACPIGSSPNAAVLAVAPINMLIELFKAVVAPPTDPVLAPLIHNPSQYSPLGNWVDPAKLQVIPFGPTSDCVLFDRLKNAKVFVPVAMLLSVSLFLLYMAIETDRYK